MDGKFLDFADGTIRGVAALIAGFVEDNAYLEQCMVEWLAVTDGDASMLPLGARRAGMAVLATDESKTTLQLNRRTSVGGTLPRRPRSLVLY